MDFYNTNSSSWDDFVGLLKKSANFEALRKSKHTLKTRYDWRSERKDLDGIVEDYYEFCVDDAARIVAIIISALILASVVFLGVFSSKAVSNIGDIISLILVKNIAKANALDVAIGAVVIPLVSFLVSIGVMCLIGAIYSMRNSYFYQQFTVFFPKSIFSFLSLVVFAVAIARFSKINSITYLISNGAVVEKIGAIMLVAFLVITLFAFAIHMFFVITAMIHDIKTILLIKEYENFLKGDEADFNLLKKVYDKNPEILGYLIGTTMLIDTYDNNRDESIFENPAYEHLDKSCRYVSGSKSKNASIVYQIVKLATNNLHYQSAKYYVFKRRIRKSEIEPLLVPVFEQACKEYEAHEKEILQKHLQMQIDAREQKEAEKAKRFAALFPSDYLATTDSTGSMSKDDEDYMFYLQNKTTLFNSFDAKDM